MSTAGKDQRMGLVNRSLGEASRLPGLTLGRVGKEVGGIWSDARMLSRTRLVPARERQRLSADVVYAGWYAGLAAMTALNMIQWQLAAVIAGAHTVERYGRRQAVRELAAGFEAGI
jgi:hypothetical protein